MTTDSHTFLQSRVANIDGPVRVLGLTGLKQSGKDTVLQRLIEAFGARTYQRVAFMDDAKRVIAGTFKLTPDQIEEMKLDPYFRITITNIKGYGRELARSLTMREVLENIGGGHRDVYGEHFYVNGAREDVSALIDRDIEEDRPRKVYVFTDVRTDVEARMIRDLGGFVFEVMGPELDADGSEHELESGISQELIDGTIDNSRRPTTDDLIADPEAKLRSLEALDDELAMLHEALSS